MESSGSVAQDHNQESFKKVNRILKNKDETNVSKNDLFCKYDIEVRHVYYSRVNYNGLRSEA